MSNLIDSPNIPDETKQLSILIYSLGCISDQLGEINKNLEKIANNTEKVQVTQETPTFHIGEHFDFKTNEYEGFETIICKQNKDSHVDKNIILD